MTLNWGNEKIIDFINQIHDHPELWDVKSEVYKNKDVKKDGWAAVAERFQITSDEAYRKFKSLRTYAKNEEKRKKLSRGGIKSIRWFAYDAISFILDQDTETDGDGSVTDATVDILETEEYHKPSLKVKIDDEEAIESEATGSSFSSVASKKPRLSVISHPEFRTKSHYSRNVRGSGITDYGPFGEHIANKLSKYDPYIRAQAEMKIMQVLYDCDMQMLSNDAEEFVPVTVLGDLQSD